MNELYNEKSSSEFNAVDTEDENQSLHLKLNAASLPLHLPWSKVPENYDHLRHHVFSRR